MDIYGISPGHLLLLPFIIPFVGAFLCYGLGRVSTRCRALLVVGATALTFSTVGLLIPHCVPDLTVRILFAGTYALSPPSLNLTPLSYTILLITTFVWMIATVYCTGYLPEEERTNRFYFFWLFSLAADLGVLIAGDFITLYTFFELLTLSVFVLITHDQTAESMAAARKYLFLGLFGSFLILAGIALLYAATGSIAIAPVTGLQDHQVYLIAGLMVLGFGVKAGMYPVHVWLPDAHSAAPTPASSVLSGVIIKVGSYGIFITTFFILFLPGDPGSLTSTGGVVVIYIGLVTMLFAVFLALMQTNAKRMLAYHSTSQMGFIILGIGCALYLGEAGALGFTGALFHVVNHALFKALLFLAVGAVFLRTGELNMYRLGGLWRSMPAAGLGMAVGVLAISGFPGFNGFVSKVFIHHALVDAGHLGGWPLLPAEAIFIVTCGGTVASTGKLLLFTFSGEKKAEGSYGGRTPLQVTAAMAALAGAAILLGVLPGIALFFILPAAGMFGFDGADLDYLAGYLGTGGLAVYTPYTVSIALLEVLVGVAIFVAYVVYGWFHWERRIPAAVSPDAWYRRSVEALLGTSRFIGIDLLSRIEEAALSADTYLLEKGKHFSARHRSAIAYLSTFEAAILLLALVLGMYLLILLFGPAL